MALELKITQYTGWHMLLYALPARWQARIVTWAWKRTLLRNNGTLPATLRVYLPTGQAWQVGPHDAHPADWGTP